MGNYLGRGLDRISNIEVLDNITFDGSSSYSITKSSVAFTPNSAQSCLISIDGVVQATNFTVSSSTINFGVAIPSTSTCNFFLHYGTGLITVPSDGSVTESKIGSNAVTTAKMFSGFANGITMADQFRLTADLANPGAVDITANLERVDTNGFAKIGTGMTESSGIFTFPSTGLFLVRFMATVFYDNDYMGIEIFVSTDGSNFVSAAMSNGGTTTVNGFFTLSGECFINVTNTSNFKVKFKTNSMTASTIEGDTDQTRTGFTFIRLGDSQ